LNSINDITNALLLQSIEEYKQNRGIREEYVFVDELEKSIFVLPIKKNKEFSIAHDEFNGKKGGTPINFLIIDQLEGKYLPAFTSLEELRKSIKDCDVVPMAYSSLRDIAMKDDNDIDGFYINPYSLGLLISVETMFYFDTIKNNSLYKAERIQFGEPIEYPTPLISIIKFVLEQEKGIRKAYFTLMQIDDNIPQFLLVLDGEYNEKDLYESIFKSVSHMLAPDVLLNIVSLNSNIGSQAIDEKSIPIYIAE
jgi:hypothetical protein